MTHKICLGAAQFGQPYGISNSFGQLNVDEVSTIVANARKLGISSIDTASSYGLSEQILGQVGVADFDISTKLPNFNLSDDFVSDCVKEECEKALSRLRVNQIETLYVHRPQDLLSKHGDKIFCQLHQLKCEGLIKKIGISFSDPSLFYHIIDRYQFEVAQFALNLMDRRLVTDGYLRKALDAHIEVHARSIFLQGLLLLRPTDMDKYFQRWTRLFREFENQQFLQGCDAVDACLSYATSIKGISKLVIGVASANQLSEVVSKIIHPLPTRIAEFDFMASTDLEIIEPWRWNLAKPLEKL